LKTTTYTLALLVALAGCAARQVPLVDIQASPAAFDGRDYGVDLAECQAYAATIDTGQSAMAGAIVGAVFSAALGAAVGGILGDAGTGAAIGAAGGGIDGLAAGAAAAEGRKNQIIYNCLNGRGWNVL
jgi:outer membrane lipoprotein SlyB